MRIRVLEYATACGRNSGASASMLVEGAAMLKTVASKLAAEGHDVATSLSPGLNPGFAATFGEPCGRAEAKTLAELLKSHVEDVDYTYVIAPEQVLLGAVRFMERTGIPHLNSSSEAIRDAGNKVSAKRILSDNNIPTPQSCVGFPCVFKPVWGVGAENTFLVEDKRGLNIAMKILPKGFMLEEYLKGTPASVIVAAGGRKAASLAFNSQHVSLGRPPSPSAYLGGVTPFEHPWRNRVMRLAEEAVECFRGLRGVVGVDFVLSDKPYVVDVNPRMVTSAVGFCAGYGVSLAGVLTGKPVKSRRRHFTAYSHVKSRRRFPLRAETIEAVGAVEGVWIPPVSYGSRISRGESMAFTVISSESMAEAISNSHHLGERIRGVVA